MTWVLVVLLVVALFAVGYLYGRLTHRVFAIGRDTYLRFYPNPGIGVCFGKRRVAVSVVGGIEIFQTHPYFVWMRTWAIGSRVKRPGGKA